MNVVNALPTYARNIALFVIGMLVLTFLSSVISYYENKLLVVEAYGIAIPNTSTIEVKEIIPREYTRRLKTKYLVTDTNYETKELVVVHCDGNFQNCRLVAVEKN